MNEKWNDYGQGAVSESEKHDHDMTTKERFEAVRILRAMRVFAKKIERKIIDGAPCAAEKSFADIDNAYVYLEFVWDRVEDYNSEQEED